MIDVELVTRQPVRLDPDPARVIAQLFVPGHALPGGVTGHASGVVATILGLDEHAVRATLSSIIDRFGSRHRDLAATFAHHADRIANRLEPGIDLSDDRRLLLGATFTHEYSVEGASLCNPSPVPLADQSGAPAGSLRFVMSVRQIGEGHRSSIGFRTGLVDQHGSVTIDATGAYATAAVAEPAPLSARALRPLARARDEGTEATAWVLDGLADAFTTPELEARLAELDAQRDTRRNVGDAIRNLRDLAARSYTATFPPATELTERVLHPSISAESNGMEDARFVRFVDDDDSVTYFATYTAFDGHAIAQQLLATTDFRTFHISPLRGAAAANKGLALFPRRIDGRFVALCRHDGASNAVTTSDDLNEWATATPLTWPREVWEAVQVGNCGPPIETDDGWLVLTHGVGPMRTYSMGALLLELDDPTTIIGRLRDPLLRPTADEQNGYVPNVVYTCGALRHADNLLIPFGVGDASIRFASASISELVEALRAQGPG